MTHEEFVARYRAGTLQVRVDRQMAARFIAARLLLPFFLLPLFGLAVALALIGQLLAGIALFGVAFGLRVAVRASGRGFVLNRSLEDPVFYRHAVDQRLLTWGDVPPQAQSRDSS